MKALNRFSVLLAVAVLAGGASAESAKQYSVEDFFRNSDFSALRLSPNGEWLAALGPYEKRRNLFAMRLDDRKSARLTGLNSKDVSYFLWANNERLLFGLDSDGNESFSLYAVNRDGTRQRELVQGSQGIVLFPPTPSCSTGLTTIPNTCWWSTTSAASSIPMYSASISTLER